MERKNFVKKVEEVQEVVSTKLRWKKLGGGSFYLNNRIIKPGEIFFADVEEIPTAFLEVLECLEPLKLEDIKNADVKETQIPEVLYKLKKVKGTDLYNLVNSEKKAFNEEPLSLEAAEEMLIVINK